MSLPESPGTSGTNDPNPESNKHDGLYLACDYPAEQDVMAVGSNGPRTPDSVAASFALGNVPG